MKYNLMTHVTLFQLVSFILKSNNRRINVTGILLNARAQTKFDQKTDSKWSAEKLSTVVVIFFNRTSVLPIKLLKTM